MNLAPRRRIIDCFENKRALARLCADTVEELRCDASHIFLWHEERQAFRAVAQAGESSAVWELAQILHIPRESLGGLAARLHREGVVLAAGVDSPTLICAGGETALADLDVGAPLLTIARRGRWRHCLIIGLILGGQLIGFQTVCRREYEGRFDAAAIAAAAQLASLAVFAARYRSLATAPPRANHLELALSR